MEVWVGGRNGPEEIDGCVPDGMMAMDVEELAARAVKVVEGHLIGVNCGPAGTQEGSRCADVGGRWGSKRRIQRDVVGISAVEGTARSAELLPGALEYGAAGPDGAGLESCLLETEDECIGPAMLVDEAARGPGGDGATASGSRGAKCDPFESAGLA
jgi:hypothetical protein